MAHLLQKLHFFLDAAGHFNVTASDWSEGDHNAAVGAYLRTGPHARDAEVGIPIAPVGFKGFAEEKAVVRVLLITPLLKAEEKDEEKEKEEEEKKGEGGGKGGLRRES